MKKYFFVIFALLFVTGCVFKNEAKIASIQIVQGGSDIVSIAEVQLIESNFYLSPTSGAALTIVVKDENGAYLDYLAEWSATNGTLSEALARKTYYFPENIGVHQVHAKVGDYVATANIKAIGSFKLMSGDGRITNAKHAMLFKVGKTEETSSADMILLNKYYPDTTYYAESNKIVFPNGFYKYDFGKMQDLLIVPPIEESEYAYELELDTVETQLVQIKGIVRNKDGSFTKVSFECGAQRLNDEPYYLDLYGTYMYSDESGVFPY